MPLQRPLKKEEGVNVTGYLQRKIVDLFYFGRFISSSSFSSRKRAEPDRVGCVPVLEARHVKVLTVLSVW